MTIKAIHIIAVALTLASAGLAASRASAFDGEFHREHVHGDRFPAGQFPGEFHGPRWGGEFGGFERERERFPVVYGGCIVKRFINDEGDLVIRKICD